MNLIGQKPLPPTIVTGGAVVLAAEISDVLSHPMNSKDLGDNILRKEEVAAIGGPTS